MSYPFPFRKSVSEDYQRAQHIVNPAGLYSRTKYIIAFYLLGASKAQKENAEDLIYCALSWFLDHMPINMFSGNEIIAR